MPSEFDLIARYFSRPTPQTLLGVGDDAALVKPSSGMNLAISTDMLAAGTHFLADADPEALGWKCLAVNVSDLAAMAARPRWAVLAVALPEADEHWIEAFARGFFACASAFGIDVIGGDTTRGPMNFCVTIFGEVSPNQALLRSGAQPGDEIWVSGIPGRAALGLAHLQGRCVLTGQALIDALEALHRPQPRVALGLALRGVATAAIDVSDGLLADLGHILERSSVAARIHLQSLPQCDLSGSDHDLVRDCQLAGGDDYELVFTVPENKRNEVTSLSAKLNLTLTCIGKIEAGSSSIVTVLDNEGKPWMPTRHGFDHFS